MPHPDWNESYVDGNAPWDTGVPDNHLVEFIRSGAIAPGRALDVGCGTGTNAVWLAQQGFKVCGIDVASLAIKKARAEAAGKNLNCRFEQLDFLSDTVRGGPFDLIFDRGCFHVFDKAKERARFAERVSSLLARNGRWLSLIGSTEGPARDAGPPRLSARSVISAIEPALEILELRSVELRANLPGPLAFWLCLSRRRKVTRQRSAGTGGQS